MRQLRMFCGGIYKETTALTDVLGFLTFFKIIRKSPPRFVFSQRRALSIIWVPFVKLEPGVLIFFFFCKMMLNFLDFTK